MKKGISLCMVVFLLAGCWDEHLNKNIAVIPMIGFDGKLGELTGYFALPGEQHQTNRYQMLSARGSSVEEVRQNVDTLVNEGIDLSKLTSILFSDESAKQDIYSYLDTYYRNAKNRLNTTIIITEGSTEPFIQYGERMGGDLNNYYSELVEGFILKSVFPDFDLQLACSYLFDEGIDLSLPYIKISDDNGVPEAVGVALFNQKRFTGKTLDRDQSIILQLMKDDKGKVAFLTFMLKDVPISFNVNKLQRKMKWDGTNVNIHYKMDIGITEYYKNNLLNKKENQQVKKILEDTITKKMEDIIKILMEENSDILGIGRYARAFHPEIFKENKWKEIYPTIKITPTVEVNVKETGILD